MVACCPGLLTAAWNAAAVLGGNFGGTFCEPQFPWCCTGAPLPWGQGLGLTGHQLCCVMGVLPGVRETVEGKAGKPQFPRNIPAIFPYIVFGGQN